MSHTFSTQEVSDEKTCIYRIVSPRSGPTVVDQWPMYASRAASAQRLLRFPGLYFTKAVEHAVMGLHYQTVVKNMEARAT